VPAIYLLIARDHRADARRALEQEAIESPIAAAASPLET